MAAWLAIAERFGPVGGTGATTRYQYLLSVAPAAKADSRRVHRGQWFCVTISDVFFLWKSSGQLAYPEGSRLGFPLVIGWLANGFR
ncbi:MAG: hypothetical protein ACK44Q_16585, partial [Pirellulaceae bacterium]